MRFTAATVALFAGLAAALPNGDVETVYQTEDVTITSCGPTVTDCPGNQAPTSTPEGAGAVTPSNPPPVATTSTEASEVASSTAVPSSSEAVPPVAPTSAPAPPSAPAPSLSTSWQKFTTCVPQVSSKPVIVTVSAPAPTQPAGGKPSVPVVPTGGASSSAGAIPSGSATPSTSAPGSLFTGAANTVSGSFGLAGAAAAAAFFLA
ncbi:hypothetical protein BDW42DRAFT_170212 [Aspergillus taichungensis]|uniref:GPI anchored serine-rich protein n=1 Tax=Aspergillus taichungensis TaxID=482145 RepID=A0A2J5HTX3_9EURO|nr:hypothetical protein BDW42DRAFT_170212 [Aspergillus taichungensis]